jgi:hypothetical protein
MRTRCEKPYHVKLSRGVTGLADKGYKLTLEERGGFVNVGFDHFLRDHGATELICCWNTYEAPIFLRLRVQPEWEGERALRHIDMWLI